MYDYSKLKGRIVEKGYNQNSLSKALDMHPNSLRDRLENRLEFKQEDMVKMCNVLGIKYGTIQFFTLCNDISKAFLIILVQDFVDFIQIILFA